MRGVYRYEFLLSTPKQLNGQLGISSPKRTLGLDLKRTGRDERKWNGLCQPSQRSHFLPGLVKLTAIDSRFSPHECCQ